MILKDSDISPFEVIHSGLVRKLLAYLTTMTGAAPRDVRIRRFLHVFLNCPVSTQTIFFGGELSGRVLDSFEGPQVRATPASLRCDFEQEH